MRFWGKAKEAREAREDQLIKDAIQADSEKFLREKQTEAQNLIARVTYLENELRQMVGSKKAALDTVLKENKRLWWL